MVKQVKQDYATSEAEVATVLSALIGSVTTYWGHHVLKIGPGRYLVTVAYDGAS